MGRLQRIAAAALPTSSSVTGACGSASLGGEVPPFVILCRRCFTKCSVPAFNGVPRASLRTPNFWSPSKATMPAQFMAGRRPAHVLSHTSSTVAPAMLDALQASIHKSFPESTVATAEETRKKYLAKYQDKIRQKAAAEGISSLEELFARRRQPALAETREPPKAGNFAASKDGTDNNSICPPMAPESMSSPRGMNVCLQSGLHGDSNRGTDGLRSPQPLSSILDLEKVRRSGLSGEEIGRMWTTYHTAKSNLLSAVIPAETYKALMVRAREFPMFLLPVPGPSGSGYELYFLQWRFNTCIMTSLAEYKAVGADAARPHLTLTHYADLALEKGIVLMRGEITEAVSDSAGTGLVSMSNAHLLAMLVQDFYGLTGGPRKKALLETFHRRPAEFSVGELIEAVNTLETR